MQNSQNRFDQAMQDYARRWMKSLDKPRYSTNISNFSIAIFIIIWASTLTNQMGYIPFKGTGIIITLSILITLILALSLLNHILARIGFAKITRTALWFSSLIGPYISILVMNNLKNPVLSHILGVFSAVAAFLFSYALDRLFIYKSQSPMDKE